MSKNAWLTPDASILTNPQDCRTISVAGDLFYLVTGCLELLAESDNWEGFGTATPEEMEQYFRNILDDYSESGCGMNWMTVPYTLFSQTYTMSSGFDLAYQRSSLPIELQRATALRCRMSLRTISTTGKICSVRDVSTNETVDWYRVKDQNVTQTFSVIAPIEGGVKFAVNEDVGNDFFFECVIVGWW